MVYYKDNFEKKNSGAILMNIESLKYFYNIARTGNISSVARDMHISQSALSQQITKLETDLSKTLMVRSNKGVSLTPTGEIVYKFAESVLKTYDNMLGDIAEYEKENMIIKIAACHSIADYGIPCTLMISQEKFPLHKYELFAGSSENIIEDVANNLFDIGFSYCSAKAKEKHKELIYIKCGTNKIVLVVKKDKATADEITMEEIVNSCMITFSGESDINNILVKNLNRYGYEQSNIQCNLEVGTIESAKTLVSRGYGIAFLPYISVKEELYKGEFKQIIVPEMEMDLDIMMLFKKNHSKYAEEFVSWFIKDGKNSFC